MEYGTRLKGEWRGFAQLERIYGLRIGGWRMEV
jgi:hypothetical protein